MQLDSGRWGGRSCTTYAISPNMAGQGSGGERDLGTPLACYLFMQATHCLVCRAHLQLGVGAGTLCFLISLANAVTPLGHHPFPIRATHGRPVTCTPSARACLAPSFLPHPLPFTSASGSVSFRSATTDAMGYDHYAWDRSHRSGKRYSSYKSRSQSTHSPGKHRRHHQQPQEALTYYGDCLVDSVPGLDQDSSFVHYPSWDDSADLSVAIPIYASAKSSLNPDPLLDLSWGIRTLELANVPVRDETVAYS